jgi:hypothetical protein
MEVQVRTQNLYRMSANANYNLQEFSVSKVFGSDSNRT